MKIEFDVDDNAILLDIKAHVFIALLKAELKDSMEALINLSHPDDIELYENNIRACNQLLEYYGAK
jgi:hypothetical protein